MSAPPVTPADARLAKASEATLVPTVDFIFGSGLRRGDPAGIVPNGGKLPHYFTMNAGIAQNFTGPGALHGFTIRVDVVNLFDKGYLIRDGSGVGVGARQYGQRRGIWTTLEDRGSAWKYFGGIGV